MARKRKELFLGSERLLSVVVFGLFFSWVMAIPYEGQIMHSLGERYGIDLHTLIYCAMLAHGIGLFVCGFFLKSIRNAKKLLCFGNLVCIFATGILFLLPSFIWYIALVIASFMSGLTVSAWAYFYRNGTQFHLRLKTGADALILSNILMILLNITSIHLSPYYALCLCGILLFGSLMLSHRLPSEEHTPKEKHTVLNLKKPMLFLCIFVVLSTIDGGLMFQVINPTYAHLTSLSSWYWTVPYVVALIVVRNLPQYANKMYFLFIAIAMAGLAFLAYWVLPVSIISYLVVDTLLLGACGIFNLFWWSILGSMLSLSNNPAKILGIGLSSNVLGVLMGGVFGRNINEGLLDSSLMITVAMAIILLLVVLLPPLYNSLSKVLGGCGYLENTPPAPADSSENLNATDPIPAIYGFDTLSAREQEVAGLLLKGYTYRAIATELHISENTVKTYVKNVYSKLEVQNRTELIQRMNKVV